MLIEVSRNINEINPKIMAAPTVMPKLPALGSKHITATAANAPMNK